MHPIIDQKNELLPFAAQVRPLSVIVLIFDKVPLQNINTAMNSLLKAALSQCHSEKEKSRLKNYHKWQGVLFQALYTIYNDKNTPPEGHNAAVAKLGRSYKCYMGGKRVSNDLQKDPTLILRRLLKFCPASFARIRLADALEKGIANQRAYSDPIQRATAKYYYRLCAGLIEAAGSLNDPSNQ